VRGSGASIADADFEAAGASIGSRDDVLKDADIILCVTGPDPASLGRSQAWLAADRSA
jgi:NAD(P) transhydrogenase subunit alpha